MQESHINLTNASERLEEVDLTIEEDVPMIVSALSEYRFVCNTNDANGGEGHQAYTAHSINGKIERRQNNYAT